MKSNKLEQPINSIVNKAIETIDLATWLPSNNDIIIFDIKPFLFKELVLREQEFRSALKEVNWEQYKDKFVLIQCSNNALVPIWAYMLLSTYLTPYVKFCAYTTEMESFKHAILVHQLELMDPSIYKDKRVVIKGCGDKSISEDIYLRITCKLMKTTRSIMYGEPCSMVPIYKKLGKEE